MDVTDSDATFAPISKSQADNIVYMNAKMFGDVEIGAVLRRRL